MSSETLPTCFIAMPITTHADEADLYGDADHWTHVIEHLFVPAAKRAGFRAILPTASGTSMIHGRIVQHLVEADMVLCDLSQHNPNVFFELGVRTALNKPITLVKDEHLGLPFDTSGLNTLSYSSTLDVWKVEEEIDALARHIQDSVLESDGKNPMWERFGVAIAAGRPTEDLNPAQARVELLLSQVEEVLERDLRGSGGSRVTASEEYTLMSAIVNVPGTTVVKIADLDADRERSVSIETEPSTPAVQTERIGIIQRVLRRHGFSSDLEHSEDRLIVLKVPRRYNLGRGETVHSIDA